MNDTTPRYPVDIYRPERRPVPPPPVIVVEKIRENPFGTAFENKNVSINPQQSSGS